MRDSRSINGIKAAVHVPVFPTDNLYAHHMDPVFWLGIIRLPAFPSGCSPTVASWAFVIHTVKRAAADSHRIPVSLFQILKKIVHADSIARFYCSQISSICQVNHPIILSVPE